MEGLVRFPGRTAASVLAISMALILFGVFGTIAVYTHGLIDLLRGNEEISVYLKDELSDAGMLEIDSAVAKLPGVESTRVVSKEDAAAEFERMFGDNLLSALDENPLPRSLIVTVAPEFRNAAGFEKVGRPIELMRGVESVEFGREWLGKMDFVFFVILILEIVLGVLVGIAGVIIIANTVGMHAASRREAIEIMRLVGATERFIRRPFYLEGAFKGLLAGIIAYSALCGPYIWVRYSLPDFELYLHTFGISKEIIETAGIYLAILIPTGGLFGLLGSHAAIRRSV
jgi:cell division transport system permease protein